MTGSIMQRIFAARWPIGIFVALLLVAWGVSTGLRGRSVLGAISAFFEGGDFDAEQRELQFWLAALGRIDTELQQQLNGPAAASLRVERGAVLTRLREVAGRVPSDNLPAEIRSLLEPPATPAPEPALAARPVEPAAVARTVGELRVGLGPRAPVADPGSLTFVAPPPLAVATKRAHPPRAENAAPSGAANRDEKRPPAAAAADRDVKRPASAAAADREEKRPPAR